MLTDKLPPEEIEVPNEPGNFFTFRVLSADEMDEARAASIRETVTRFGPETMNMMAAMKRPDPENRAIQEAEAEAAKATAGPATGFSHGALVKLGLVSWRGANYDGSACDDETKTRLTEKVRAWAADEIARMSVISVGEAGSSGDGIAASGPSPAPLSELSNES